MSSSTPLTLIPSDLSLLLKHRTSSDSSTPRLSLTSLLPPSHAPSAISSSAAPPNVPAAPSRAPADAPASPEQALKLVRDLIAVSGEAKLAEGKVDALGERVEAVRGRLEDVQGALTDGMKGWGMEARATQASEAEGELA